MAQKIVHDRPLSPHLQVYRPQMTSVLSITHRAAGYALSLGIVLVIWLLVAAASGAGPYSIFQAFASSVIGKIMFFGWSAALFYHLCNGIRHLFWDMGYLFKIEQAYRVGYAVLAASVLLTVFFWLIVL